MKKWYKERHRVFMSTTTPPPNTHPIQLLTCEDTMAGFGVDESNPDLVWYGYIPSKAITIIFVLLFNTSSILHLWQAVKYRTWFMLGTAFLCGGMETIGWAARFYSSLHPTSSMAYKIQTSLLVLAPTPLLAANFVIFGRLIRQLGQSYSRLKPRRYTMIFASCDVISLFVQGGGGGLAASAHDSNGARLGSNIILAGIILQSIIIIGFSACAIEYFVNYRRAVRTNAGFRLVSTEEASDPRQEQLPGRFTAELKRLTGALILNTTFLFVRAIYRIIELAGGWDGRIMRTQIYFNVLDGAMIALAIYCTNFAHPGAILGPSKPRRNVVYA
ncbi:hypothetical protein HYPSUDRAFT_162133 [Hypholoma sublateritium FD-334 SS-4]|uniref:RTA1 like protein n=1 Tax=Hypholoma sublateritium (strain FD-334 SS-4) TaxID=945553 RepID=A0A0D2PY99_HYPSF|nr:hypothetical protein HYPSUDRAFT_162133 [Hypholoma sublateritium FD-334 SS-4]